MLHFAQLGCEVALIDAWRPYKLLVNDKAKFTALLVGITFAVLQGISYAVPIYTSGALVKLADGTYQSVSIVGLDVSLRRS